MAAVFAWRMASPGNDSVQVMAAAAPAKVAPSLGEAAWQAPHAASEPKRPDVAAAPEEADLLYGRNGRYIHLGGLTVADYVKARMADARMGQAKAAYEVYAALSLCTAAEGAAAVTEREPLQADDLRERAQRQRVCAQVSPAQVQERLQFLAVAARRGVPQALMDYYTEGPYGRDVDPEQMQHDPLAQQWRTQALAYLQQAAAQCEPRAYRLLATQYETGELSAADARQALAYSVAEAQAMHKPVNASHLRRRYGGQLKPEELISAQQQGLNIAKVDCGA
jgi:TPR repeat protein